MFSAMAYLEDKQRNRLGELHRNVAARLSIRSGLLWAPSLWTMPWRSGTHRLGDRADTVPSREAMTTLRYLLVLWKLMGIDGLGAMAACFFARDVARDFGVP